MSVFQWQRAEYIINLMNAMQSEGRDVLFGRAEIERKVNAKFTQCHSCLLLAVYGLYKNGIIENTIPLQRSDKDIDFFGFDGAESVNIRHAFDALDLLKRNPQMTANKLKEQLGGDLSIYSFVVHYFKNNLIRSR